MNINQLYISIYVDYLKPIFGIDGMYSGMRFKNYRIYSDSQNNNPITRGAGSGQILVVKLITCWILNGKGLLLAGWANDGESLCCPECCKQQGGKSIGSGHLPAKGAVIVHLDDQNLPAARTSSFCLISEHYFENHYSSQSDAWSGRENHFFSTSSG